MRLLPLLLLVGCVSTSHHVDKTQNDPIQPTGLIEQRYSWQVKALCGGLEHGGGGCVLPGGTVVLLENCYECAIGEIEHLIYGRCHFGDIECLRKIPRYKVIEKEVRSAVEDARAAVEEADEN